MTDSFIPQASPRPRFDRIPQFTRSGSYQVNIRWSSLEHNLADYIEQGLEMDPDFQRSHVWDESKQIRFVEYVLRGGKSSRDIYLNHTNWQIRKTPIDWFVLVDGKQRIEAVRKFLRGELRAFGHYLHEYEDEPRSLVTDFIFHINDLPTRVEVLQWYIDINRGGIVHTDEEIAKVERLLEEERQK